MAREMVEYIINELDLTIIIKQLEMKDYGIDEILFSTLESDENIGVPNGFTNACLDKGIEIDYVTRYYYYYS